MTAQASALNDPTMPAYNSSANHPAFEAQQLVWSVRREIWENRSLYLAPIAAAALILFGFLVGALGLAHGREALQSLDTTQQLTALDAALNLSAGVFMGVGMIVALFYCLDALYGERRDRSVLFWKSLPISDLNAVLAKASIPLLVLPSILTIATIVTQGCMLLFASVSLLTHGHSPVALWTGIDLSQRWVLLAWHLFAIHAFWYAPFFGWLFFVSAWARRAPFLWAFLPPLAIVLLEKLVFNTGHFAHFIAARFGGGDSVMSMNGQMPIAPGTHVTVGPYLTNAGLWLGFLVTALLLAAAVQLRRFREVL